MGNKVSRRAPIAERLGASYEVDEAGCHLFRGHMHCQGYGVIGYEGKPQLAHRVSWRLHRGSIPEGMKVCHRCGVPACINPDHLFLGTQKDNVHDMRDKGRGPNRFGVLNGRAKLNEDDARRIKALLASGVGCSELSKQYDVAYQSIWQIKIGNRWAHV